LQIAEPINKLIPSRLSAGTIDHNKILEGEIVGGGNGKMDSKILFINHGGREML
jgi:hypothetical protein